MSYTNDQLQTMLEDYKSQTAEDYNISQEQRDAANEDTRFVTVDGGMWEDWLTTTHSEESNRARPQLDVTSDILYRFVGEWTKNRAQVLFEPLNSKTGDEDADMVNGIYRADFKDNDGQASQDLAVKETATCGHGAYILCSKYEDDGDPENENQDIYWEEIQNAFNHVIWDKNAKRDDKSDARHCTVLEGFTEDALKDKWPKADLSSAYTPTNRSEFNWRTSSEIYVAKRYTVKLKKVTVQVWQNLQTDEVDNFEDHQIELIGEDLRARGWTLQRRRKITKRTIERSVFTGTQFLERPTRIAGEWIPVISMYAFRTYVDGVEHYRGIVRKYKDPNRIINTNLGRMTEAAATSGDRIPIYTRQQVEGLESNLKDNTNKAYQVINEIENEDGSLKAEGPVGWYEPNSVDPNTVASTELVDSYVQRAGGNLSSSEKDPEQSGRAMDKVTSRANMNHQVILDNILKAIKHEGRVYLSMFKEIYGNTREKRSMAVDMKTASTKMINRPAIERDEYGDIQTILQNDTSKGKYKVNVTVGPQYDTQREATLDSVERIMGVVGEQSSYFGPLLSMWVENVSGTGLDPLKEFNRKQMLISGLVAPDPEDQEEMMLVQQAAQKKSPQDALQEAAAQQQMAEAKYMKAGAGQRLADAQKKTAETAKIKSETKNITREGGADFIARRMEKVLKSSPAPVAPRRLRYNPKTGSLDPVNDARSRTA